jgi:hypothetical protein
LKHKATLIRLSQNKKQTLGRFFLFKGLDLIFDCVVLELPDENNANSISRICAGVYKCVLRTSEKYGLHYHVTDVTGRTLILIHFGNYYTDTRGCLLFGQKFAYINSDGEKDITSSKSTINKLMKLGIEEFELTINDV